MVDVALEDVEVNSTKFVKKMMVDKNVEVLEAEEMVLVGEEVNQSEARHLKTA